MQSLSGDQGWQGCRRADPPGQASEFVPGSLVLREDKDVQSVPSALAISSLDIPWWDMGPWGHHSVHPSPAAQPRIQQGF